VFRSTDVLVIGSGIAGLFYSINVADTLRVTIVTKKQAADSNTNYAQGGIAAVFDPEDSFEDHIRDTIEAGAGLCHRDIVELVVREGPELVQDLIQLGVEFTRERNKLDLGREGGHSHNRIVHAKDLTGWEIEHALLQKCREHPNIEMLENHFAIDLITEHNLKEKTKRNDRIHCWGAHVLDRHSGAIDTFLAKTTVLCTGGAGRVYLHTTNPPIATGDGIAMAYRAGARVGNLEFIQFHPTTLCHPAADSFLISEAVRGFGAYLRTRSGERFMQKYDERGELAPRDIVARAIDAELKKSGEECVYLDLRHLDPEEVKSRFPHIYKRCLEFKIDMTKEYIPVVPAAHYICGGVVTDEWARTSIQHLFACGEVANTGLHGANRLASNSLLEALVFADRAAKITRAEQAEVPDSSMIEEWDDTGTYNTDEWVLISHNRKEVATIMWDYVGIVRSTLRLQRAQRRIDLIWKECEDFYKRTKVSSDLIELRNIVTVASLVVRCALSRKESRGLHYTTDYPEPDTTNPPSDTIFEQIPVF